MRVACLFFGALFLVGAGVQWNDPDPLVWIVGYLLGAGLSFHAAGGGRAFAANAIAALAFVGWFATLAATVPGAPEEAFTSFEMRDTSHEEPREAVGLLLLAGWSAVLAVRARSVAADRSDAALGRTS